MSGYDRNHPEGRSRLRRPRLGRWLLGAALLGLLAVGALTALAAWLLLTPGGARWAVGQAVEREPRLDLEIRGGTLWKGLDLADVSWRDEGIEVSLDRTALRWRLACLLDREVCLDLLDARGLRVDVDTAAFAAEDRDEAAAPAELFPPPVRGSFSDVRVEDVELSVDGHRVVWGWLSISGRLGAAELDLAALALDGLAVAPAGEDELLRLDRLTLTGALDRRSLRLAKVELSGLALTVPRDPDDEPAEETLDLAALLDPDRRTPIELPELRLPLDVYLGELELRDGSVTIGEDLHVIRRLELSGDLVGSDLALRRLWLEHPQLTASLVGRVSLTGDYPLELTLEAEVRDPAGEAPLALSAALRNSVADLELELAVDGPGHLAAAGTLRPLAPELPVDLELAWTAVAWPLEGPATVASRDGAARVRGDLRGASLTAELDLEGEAIPPGRWRLAATGDFTHLNLERLEGRLLEGRAGATGRIGWVDGIDWDLRLRAADIDPSLLVAEAPERLDGEVATWGRLDGDAFELDAEILRLEARLRGELIVAEGSLAHRPHLGWSTPGLRLESDGSRLELAGRAGESIELAGSLEVDSLGRFVPGLGGTLRGTFSARGPFERPDVELELEGHGLAWEDELAVARLHVEAIAEALGEAGGHLRLEADGIELPERELAIDALRLAADGTRPDHRIALTARAPQGTVSLAVAGDLDEALGWEGRLERASVAAGEVDLELTEPAAVTWEPEAQRASVAPHCWVHREARLCAPEGLVLGAAGEAAVTLAGYELEWLAPWLPEGIRPTGVLAAEARADWGETPLPRVEARIVAGGGTVELTRWADGDDPETVELAYERLTLRLDVDDERLRAHLELLSEDLGAGTLEADVALDEGGRPGELAGAVALHDLRLGLAQPFLPEVHGLTGRVSAEGRLSGSATAPRFDGSLRLVDGEIETVAMPVRLTDLRAEVGIEGNRATLTGSFRSGGEARVSGEASWSALDDWRADLELEGTGLTYDHDGIARVKLDPELRIALAPGRIETGGRVTVPEAEITLKQLPEGAVQVSPDVVVLTGEAELPADELALPVAAEWSMVSDLRIVLGERVEMAGFGITGRLTGELRVRQVDQRPPEVHGQIRIEDGHYRAYGQRLVIRQGRFLFTGPADAPEIFLEAVRDVPRYDTVAGLRVEGRGEDVRLTLFSEPALPDEEVLAFLLLGRPLGEAGPEGGNAVARAALSFGIARGGGYVTALAEDIGIEEFVIDTAGEGEEVQFVVSGYLGPNLFLSYGVGVFMPESTLTVRYRLTESLFLEAVRGVEHALDVLYSFEF